MDFQVFDEKAPWIMELLRLDFDLDLLSTAATVGNLGYESKGFTDFQEDKPSVPGSRGGWGWAQWTGDRRRKFEAYCKRNNLDPKSDRANYGWLFVELRGAEKKVIPALKSAKATRGRTELQQKTYVFETLFERAGHKNYTARYTYAERALAAYGKAKKPIALPVWAREADVPVEQPEQTPTAAAWATVGVILLVTAVVLGLAVPEVRQFFTQLMEF